MVIYTTVDSGNRAIISVNISNDTIWKAGKLQLFDFLELITPQACELHEENWKPSNIFCWCVYIPFCDFGANVRRVCKYLGINPLELHVTISSKGWIYHDTDFSGLNLGGQDFSRCRFYDCNFNDTDLRTTTFRETKFDGCTFNGADLRGNTSDEGLIVKDNCSLTGAKIDENSACIWKLRNIAKEKI